MLMKCSVTAAAIVVGLCSGVVVGAQSGSVYVDHDKVNAALARGGVLVSDTKVRVAGNHLTAPATLPVRADTSILYVTDGEGTFVAGGKTQRLTKGAVMVVPAGSAHAFTAVTPSISYYLVNVPVTAKEAKAEVVYAAPDKVAATLKKAGPLGDAPNARVSGGYRTGPYAPDDYRPDVEIHESEGDLFYVIEGSATQVLGGTVTGSRQTGPGQIRGAKIEGGTTYQLRKGDVMWVPAGVPHWFPEIPQPLSYLLVKVFY